MSSDRPSANGDQGHAGLPFDRYPHRGRSWFGKRSGGNCRHEYGLQFMKITRETCCAYCGIDLTSTFERWLTISLDHVVPTSVCGTTVPVPWREDYANSVLACSACNGLDNRYQPEAALTDGLDEETFFALRDEIFVERKERILRRREAELGFFDSRPWLR
jgi:hypothetical protein